MKRLSEMELQRPIEVSPVVPGNQCSDGERNVTCTKCWGVIEKRCACSGTYRKCFCINPQRLRLSQPMPAKEWEEII